MVPKIVCCLLVLVIAVISTDCAKSTATTTKEASEHHNGHTSSTKSDREESQNNEEGDTNKMGEHDEPHRTTIACQVDSTKQAKSDPEFKKFKAQCGRVLDFNSSEELKSFRAFQISHCEIEAIQKKQPGFQVELNCETGDLEDGDFKKTHLGGNYPTDDEEEAATTAKHHSSRSSPTTTETTTVSLTFGHRRSTTMSVTETPATTTTTTTTTATTRISSNAIDWRKHNAVSQVYSQGKCGCCWSFSATGAVEGAYAIKCGTLVPLSNQQLIDCARDYHTNGCNGGVPAYAMNYIQTVGGQNSYASYPFTGDGSEACKFDSASTYGKLATSNQVKVTKGDENALLEALKKGPVSVGICASQPSFKHYKAGIYDDEECNLCPLDHAVLAVGFGKNETSGESYWIVKNSWSESWGEGGFVRMRFGVNICGIANQAVYPEIADDACSSSRK